MSLWIQVRTHLYIYLYSSNKDIYLYKYIKTTKNYNHKLTKNFRKYILIMHFKTYILYYAQHSHNLMSYIFIVKNLYYCTKIFLLSRHQRVLFQLLTYILKNHVFL